MRRAGSTTTWFVALALWGALVGPVRAQSDAGAAAVGQAEPEAPRAESEASADVASPQSDATVSVAEQQPGAPTHEPALDAADPQPVQQWDHGLRVTLALGAGLGTRAHVRPTGAGGQELETTPFAAVDVGLHVLAWPAERFSLGFDLRYQSSVGMAVQLEAPFALPERLRVRSERLELGVAPTWRTSASRRAIGLSFPVGFTLRMFWPEVRETVPGWYLAGPHARVEVVAPLGDWMVLRFGPELYWAAALHPALKADGTDAMGIGVGGQASLVLALAAAWGLEVSYREAHAFAGAEGDAASFRDSERFATLRLRWTP